MFKIGVAAVAFLVGLSATALATHTPESARARVSSNVGMTAASSAYLQIDPYAGLGSADGQGFMCNFWGNPFSVGGVRAPERIDLIFTTVGPLAYPSVLLQGVEASLPLLPGTGRLAEDPLDCIGQTTESQYVQAGASSAHVVNVHHADFLWSNAGSAVAHGPGGDPTTVCAIPLSGAAFGTTAPAGFANALRNSITAYASAGSCIDVTSGFDFSGEFTTPERLASSAEGISIPDAYGNQYGVLEFCYRVWIVKGAGLFEKLEDYTWMWHDGPANAFSNLASWSNPLTWDSRHLPGAGVGGNDQHCM